MRTKSSQSGRSMVEMLGVIAIIGLITVGAVTSVGFVDNMYRTNATLIDADKLAKDIIDTYSWSNSYEELNLEFLCNENILTCQNNVAKHRWGGNITVAPAHSGGELEEGKTSDNNSFIITYEAVPKSACEMIINSQDNLAELTIQTTSCTTTTDIELKLK